ncbi:unnamed protein product [Rhizophagus irregularis]|nr:unnamed protein product [Rhizophagus irregularis]
MRNSGTQRLGNVSNNTFPYHHNRVLYRLLVSKKSKKHIAERRPHLENLIREFLPTLLEFPILRKGRAS